MEPYNTETQQEGGSSRVVDSGRYANQRSQVFWRLREDLRLNQIALPKDEGLFEELTAIEYEEPNGKVTVTPKDKLRPKLNRSPDMADSVAYGNWARPRTRPKRVVKPEETDNPNRDYRFDRMVERKSRQEEQARRRFQRELQRAAKGGKP